MSTSFIEVNPLKKSGSVSVKPYFDEAKQNMGLEIYGMSLFDGVFHQEQLASVEQHGVIRYLTGLNEFAPEIKLIKDDDERNAKIKEIRTVVADLEKELVANVLDVNDSDFWNKVKLLRPDNAEFWGKIDLRCSNATVFLDPAKDPYDRIRIYAIDAGGFSMVAKSFDAARKLPVAPKFYLDKQTDTISTKTEYKKIRNKALSALQELFDKNTKKLLYVTKVVDINSVQYKKSTPVDVLYDAMDRHINGESVEKNKMRASQSFLDISNLDMEILKLRALIKDATFYKVISHKPDGYIYHIESNTMMGKNPAEIVEYLKNPLNEEILGNLIKVIEKHWDN